MIRKRILSRYSLYRKYEEDLWGTLLLFKRKKLTKILRLMHLRLLEVNYKFRMKMYRRLNLNLKFNFDSSKAPRKRKYYMPHVAHKRAIRKLRFFYGVMTERNFRYYILRSRLNSRRMSSFFLINFENRVDVILMRLNIFYSVFQIRQLLLHRKIYINDKLITHGSVQLKKNDLISFSPCTIKSFIKTMRKRRFVFPIQSNIEWDFGLLVFLITTPYGRLLKKQYGFFYPRDIKKHILQIGY